MTLWKHYGGDLMKNKVFFAIISVSTTVIIVLTLVIVALISQSNAAVAIEQNEHDSQMVITDNLHSRVAMVTEIDEKTNLVTVTCANGNVFSFYDTEEDWFYGDLCGLIMHDSGTDIVYDDVVVSARYGGFVELFEEIEASIEE